MSRENRFEIKENPFNDWNFKKHLCFVGTIYTAAITISNLFCFVRCAYREQKRIDTAPGPKGTARKKYRSKVRNKYIKGYVKNPPHAFRVLNTILVVCMILDISAYPVLRRTLNKIDKMI